MNDKLIYYSSYYLIHLANILKFMVKFL